MTDTLGIVVRFIHIFFGVAWVGGAVFFMNLAMQMSKKMPPQLSGPALLFMGRRAFTFFEVAGPATIVFGVWNQYNLAGGLNYASGLWNVALGAALVLALAMIAVALTVIAPALKTLERLAPKPGSPPGPPPPEFEAARKRQMFGGMTSTALGVVALSCMVIAVANRTGYF